MGIPFPRGIKILSASGKDEIIAVMWGINRVMSIAGDVLSVILSMEFGFNIAILAGGVVYTLISLSDKFIIGLIDYFKNIVYITNTNLYFPSLHAYTLYFLSSSPSLVYLPSSRRMYVFF